MTNHSSVKKFSYVSFGGMMTTGIQAIFYIILALILDPGVYGKLSYFIALASTFAIISRFGVSSTVVVYQSQKKEILVDEANIFSLITAVIASLLLLLIDPFVAFLCLTISFFIMNQFNLLGIKNYKAYFSMGVLRSGIILFLPFILYFILNIEGILIGIAFANLFASMQFFKMLNLKIRSFHNLKSDYKVIIHNFGVEVSQTLPRWIDKLIIVPILGFAVTGIYQLNIQILLALTVLPIALRLFLLSEESAGLIHKKISFGVILGSIFLAIAGSLLSPYFVTEIFPNYIDGVEGLQIMVFAIIPFTITAMFIAKLQAKKSTKVGFSAVVSIGSLLALITILGEPYGIIGLSVAVLLSAILESLFVLVIFYLERKKGKT